MNTMPMTFLKALVTALTLYTANASALSVCLNARSAAGPASGHSFVTIESNGRVLQSYGMWPPQKHPGMIAIDKVSDLPFFALRARNRGALPPNFLDLTEGRLCRETQFRPEQARDLSYQYLTQIGPYKTMSNNCTHFAIRIYNALSGDNFPVVQTPLRVVKLLSKEPGATVESATN